ncbi:hypothetical protein FQN60_012054 [Etheostoma spectabile]|uniref:Uncharacterized protein n=1 Tax=Etheostoma spectabile TaxID=54343 RepID=A0A5J5DNT3_9PERO|nr:hypothetical protein FQN60_012054 [Etheostoma spectabile]
MFLSPHQKLLPEHAQTGEICMGVFDPHTQVTSCLRMFPALQSVVRAGQEKDTESLKSLQTELWPLLTAEQNHLSTWVQEQHHAVWPRQLVFLLLGNDTLYNGTFLFLTRLL